MEANCFPPTGLLIPLVRRFSGSSSVIGVTGSRGCCARFGDDAVIANDLQYRVTQRAARDFEVSLERLDVDAKDRPEWVRRAMREAIESQLADLRGEMAEYDELRAG